MSPAECGIGFADDGHLHRVERAVSFNTMSRSIITSSLAAGLVLALSRVAGAAELAKLKEGESWPVVAVVIIIVLCTFLVSIKPGKREHRD